MEVLGWRCWGGSICVLCHTYCRAQVTLPRREWSGESDVKPGGKEQCLGAWDITLGRGCLRGDRGTGGYGGETGPLPVAGRGFHWKCCMQLTSTHSWPANSCTQQAVPLRCPTAQNAAASRHCPSRAPSSTSAEMSRPATTLNPGGLSHPGFPTGQTTHQPPPKQTLPSSEARTRSLLTSSRVLTHPCTGIAEIHQEGRFSGPVELLNKNPGRDPAILTSPPGVPTPLKSGNHQWG